MERLGYLERILNEYRKKFDIYENYKIDNEIIDAYGYFNSQNEKYFLTREVQLWETRGFEHIFFIQRENLNMETLEKFLSFIPNKIEPDLIRRGKKYADRNHMYSYVTLIFITNNIDDIEMKKRIKKYKFERNYLFLIRGYIQSRIVLIDLERKEITTNKMGKKLEKLYKHFI